MSFAGPGTNSEAIRDLIAEAAAEWYVLHREGALSPAQSQEFLRWLRASPQHVREYLAISAIGADLGAALHRVQTPTDALVADALAQDAVVTLPNRRRDTMSAAARRRPQQGTLRPAAIAAAAVVLIGSAAVMLWSLPRDDSISTRRGEQRTQELADGTIVRLNSDTELAVDFGPAARRVDVRRGQAMFEVAKDRARPFSVHVGNATIEDIGTVFDVSTTAADTMVTVIEGRVAIWNRDAREHAAGATSAGAQPLADLGVGEQALIAASGKVDRVAGANLGKATAWTRQEIMFDHDSIASVAAEFNRYNRLQVRIDDASIARIPISGVLRAYDVHAFADFLNGLPNVHATIDAHEVRVQRH